MIVTKKHKADLAKDDNTGELANLRNQLARALADYDNLRKRVEKEKEVWMRVAIEMVVSKLLPVLDTLVVAHNHLGDQGLAIAIGQFKDVLKEEQLEEIKPEVGDEFNAELHEVVDTLEGGEKGEVAELVLTGWKFKDQVEPVRGLVVRFAKVKVYGEPANEEKEVEKETTK